MAFSDYIKDGFDDVHFAGGFQHSEQILSPLGDAASDADKAARSAKATEIAKEIGECFDEEMAEPSRVVEHLFQTMRQYWSASAPLGAMPIPPPAGHYEQQAAALQRCVDITQAYDADARKLAEAGAPKLKEYIDAHAADSKGALDTLRSMQKEGIASAPMGYNGGPGAMMLDPYGNYVPMAGGSMAGGPMAGAGPVWPMPYGGPGPFTPMPFSNPFGPPTGYMSMPVPPGMGGPMSPFPQAPFPPMPMPQMPAMGGGMSAGQIKIMADSQRDVNNIMAETHRNTVATNEAINKKWSDYFKS